MTDIECTMDSPLKPEGLFPMGSIVLYIIGKEIFSSISLIAEKKYGNYASWLFTAPSPPRLFFCFNAGLWNFFESQVIL